MASRVNSNSGYYPSVEELLVAMNNDVDYKTLTGKLTKDWLHCLLKATPVVVVVIVVVKDLNSNKRNT